MIWLLETVYIDFEIAFNLGIDPKIRQFSTTTDSILEPTQF